MRVLVFGGRDFTNQKLGFKALDYLHDTYKFTLVISGKARGADTIAENWAHARQIPFKGFTANWNTYGRAAGPIRNQQMIDEGKPDMGVAFPGGTGTAHMKSRLKAAGITVKTVTPKFI